MHPSSHSSPPRETAGKIEQESVKKTVHDFSVVCISPPFIPLQPAKPLPKEEDGLSPALFHKPRNRGLYRVQALLAI
jgi:hypothetical protein